MILTSGPGVGEWRRVQQCLAVSVVATLLLNGCSHHRVSPATGPYTDAEVQDLIEELDVGEHAHVWLLDGTDVQGKLTCVDAEMICFGRTRVPWDQVERIESVSVAQGPLLMAVIFLGVVGVLMVVGAAASANGF